MAAREYRLYPPISRFLRNRGWRVRTEVSPTPRSLRRFDVVGVKLRSKDVLVVEAKLKDYRRALDQASNRLFVADLVYVAFPAPYAGGVMGNHLDELGEVGIGLLGVDGRVRELLPAARSAVVSPERKTELVDAVLGRRRQHG